MSDPVVAFQFSEPKGYMPYLEHGLKARGVRYTASHTNKFSWADTVLWAAELAGSLGSTPLVIIDAWDTIMVGSKGELEALIPTDHVLLSGDIACWPDDRLSDYAIKAMVDAHSSSSLSSLSPWCFVNPTPMCGPANLIAEAIEYGWRRWPIAGDSNDLYAENGTDMRFWTRLFLESKQPIKIDVKCEFAQCLHRAPPRSFAVTRKNRLFNLVTKTEPVFVHANGKSIIPQELLDGASD